MGVVSRRVVPACGNICFFCPSMRARSRQPVKRYKKLLSEIFPKSQDAEPNDRKIGKLCDYVSKNPLRIPKITDYLEQKCYKDLRHENFGSVKVVLHIYRRFLSSCKEHMPFFASSLMGIVRTLLEQNRHDKMRILGCNALVDFISNQTDSTHMFNLEGLIPKLSQLAQEVGDDERALRLRSAGLQTLSFMVWFMGEHSHLSMDFDTIVSVTLENYTDPEAYPENGGQLQVQDLSSSLVIINKTDTSLSKLGITVPQPTPSVDTSKCPSFWSRVCLHNMARLSKEATTVRRVLEPLFLNFDAENSWSPEKGHACSILAYLQSLLQESGDKSHLLVSILVKHLDHKNVAKQLKLQIDIANVIANLSKNARQKVSLAIVSTLSDLIRHLRKCMQNSEASRSGDGSNSWDDFQSALEESISQLSEKVGDVGPILDMIAVVLESISASNMIARATISAVYRVVQIVSTVPNISYHKKVFPDALFHQLLLAMAHPDNETRVKAHYLFSVVLVPSGILSAFPKARSGSFASHAQTIRKSDTRNGGELAEEGRKSLDDAAFPKARSGSFANHARSIRKSDTISGGELTVEGRKSFDAAANQPTHSPYRDQSFSFKHATSEEKTVLTSLRLSSHQVSLLLSSIWVQATSPENSPSSFEAMAHTFKIALMFTRSKTSSHLVLVRCFQLAFSLLNVSLDQEGGLQPSHRRSLFTFGSYMLTLSSKAANLPELIPLVKDSLKDGPVDPYLKIIDDARLQALPVEPGDAMSYGSEADEVSALKCLSTIALDDKQLKETVLSHFITKFSQLSEDDISGIKIQLQQSFSPDDGFHLGVPLFMETPWPCSPLARMEFETIDEVPNCFLTDEDTFGDANGSQSDRKSSLSINTLDIQSVGQLLESVLETARQVASLPVSSTPIPYDQMKTQCEALVTGKQQKMSVLQSFKNQEVQAITLSGDEGGKDHSLLNQKTELLLTDDHKLINNADHFKVAQDHVLSCSVENGHYSFRLPPSSPYDKFLKAAGC